MTIRYDSQQERIQRNVTIDENGCWNWMRRVEVSGYGYTSVNSGKTKRGAHRVSYEAFVGPIPTGLHIDHLCRNRRCVNPEHLEPDTAKENIRRGVLVLTLIQRHEAYRTRSTCKYGHPLSANIRDEYASGYHVRRCKTCVSEYGKRCHARRKAGLVGKDIDASAGSGRRV